MCEAVVFPERRTSAQSDPSGGEMESFRVKLTDKELAGLNQRFPASQGSNQIGDRAIEIVRLHFRRTYPTCQFVPPVAGADLAVLLHGEQAKQFEVKGTASAGIAWQQLKVSSQASHGLLTSGGASVLRVTSVYGDEPTVFELLCGRDFLLKPEARWCVKPISVAD
jgi:hypothetical protein